MSQLLSTLFASPEPVDNLTKKIPCRDLDALMAHTRIMFMRYMFLFFECGVSEDHRTSEICGMPGGNRCETRPIGSL